MNRFVLHIFLLLSVFSLKGQNLVYNGGFEEYYSCPVSNDLGNDQLELAKGWWKPTLGTSDYFNRCNNFEVGIPNNFWGYQEAFEGDAYVGFGAAEWVVLTKEYIGSEYIQSKLVSVLKPCHKYHFTMYVSMANDSQYGVGRIGAVFSADTVFNHDTEFFIDSKPSILNDSDPITDSIGWFKIEGDFIAKEYEQYITIGYFFPDVTGDTSFIQDFSTPTFASYYYVDNILLFELGSVSSAECTAPEIKFPNVITANNDGINDLIDVSNLLSIVSEIRIMNRWGNTVAILGKDNPIWDGGDCTQGIYYFLMDFPEETEIKQQNGFIHLMR